MKERPILFSGPMVRALLAGTKTQTRRIVKLDEFQPSKTKGYDWTFRGRGAVWQDYRNDRIAEKSPYGVVGDRLWVKETFFHGRWTESHFSNDMTGRSVETVVSNWAGPEAKSEGIHYVADLGDAVPPPSDVYRWTKRPAIFMYRWASRLLLEVTAVRVERLQSIDELDALAEGVEGRVVTSTLDGKPGEYVVGPARDAYAALWDDINGDTMPWSSNPWVWVVSFKRAE